MKRIELIATASFGLEAVVAREVKKLGYEDLMVENSRVTFHSDLAGICRSNLWLRSADRVLVKMGEFTAISFEELFNRTRSLPWADWLPVNATFPVNGKSIRSQLHSVPDCQAIVKKAIVENMKARYHKEWFDETGPRYVIEVAILNDLVTLTLDTSGAGLHKRGYRKLSAAAPLKETLAAAMLDLSRWHPDRLLLDPFCGSGTIPIEAAMIAMNQAPGLKREFDAEHWPVVPTKLWADARTEAQDLLNRDMELKIRGTDIDGEVLSLARYHARQAGVEGKIHFQQMPVSNIQTKEKYGFLVSNPPYGQRLEDLRGVEKLYREMGSIFKKNLETWSFYVITSHKEFEQLFGRRADKKRKLYNGRIETHFYQFYGPKPPRREVKPEAEIKSDI